MPAPVAAATAASFGQALGQSAASTGATGLISGALGQLFGGMNARRQWRFQQKQMALQQRYALEQMQKQSELSYANWQKQFDYENAYNDPTKVFDRYLKAGVTPAAVLGSSGVGVNATMSGGSAGMPSASGPSGGAPVSPGAFAPGDPAAIAQNMVAQSTVDRNAAAANLDNAQADDIRNKMPTREQGQALIELEKQLKQANIGNQSSLARYYGELAINQEAYNKYADLAATYDFQRIQAAYAEQVERTKRIRAENDAEIPLLEQSAAANLAYLRAVADAAKASARESRSHADILDIQQKDMQHMFEVTWETPVRVPLVNEKGEPTGEFEEITGREYYSYLRGLDLGEGRQSLSGNWFAIRKNKNALFYDVTKAFATAAGIAVASYAGRKAAGPAGPEGYEETKEFYSPNGDQIGATYTRRSMFRRK
jgi:hypothetical protein